MTHTAQSNQVHADIRAQAYSLRRSAALLAGRAPAPTPRPDATPIFAGCGTSYHLAQGAAAVARSLAGRRAAAVPAGDAWMFPEIHLDPETRPALVAISRSGTTTETSLLAGLGRDRGIPVLAVGVDGRDLAAIADEAITLEYAHEDSVVMTQSFSNLLLALHWVAAGWAGDAGRAHAAALPDVAAAVGDSLDRLDAAAATVASRGHRHFVFLGSGSLFPVALEGMLKMKEMTQLPAEAYHSLEFRHGPISTVEPGSLVVILASPAHLAEELAVGRDVAELGGVPLVVVAEGTDTMGLASVALPSGFSDLHAGLLGAPFLQFLALHQTTAIGLDPDAPRHLNPVVTLVGH